MSSTKPTEPTENTCAALVIIVLFSIPAIQLLYFLSVIPGFSRFIKLNGLVTQSIKQNIYLDDILFETKKTVFQTTFSIYDSYSNTTSCLIPQPETEYVVGQTYPIYLNVKSINYLTHSAKCYENPPNQIFAGIFLLLFLGPIIFSICIVCSNLYKYFCTNLNKRNNYRPVEQVEMV